MQRRNKIIIISTIVVLIIGTLFLVKKDKETYVFYVPHQDDETLFMSSVIINAIDDNIETIIVCVTDGSKSKAIDTINKYLENEDLPQIDSHEFVVARNEELLSATSFMGVEEENVYFMNQIDADLNYHDIENLVKKFENKYRNATHITLIGDVFCSTEEEKLTHMDHRLIGNVVYNMVKSKKIDSAKFISYIEKKENTKKINLKSSQKKRYQNAMESYGVWDPQNDKYSIGYISVGKLFDFHKNNPVNEYYEVN